MSLPTDIHGDEVVPKPDTQGSLAAQPRPRCHPRRHPKGHRRTAPAPHRLAPPHIYSQLLARKVLSTTGNGKWSGGRASVKETKASGQ